MRARARRQRLRRGEPVREPAPVRCQRGPRRLPARPRTRHAAAEAKASTSCSCRPSTRCTAGGSPRVVDGLTEVCGRSRPRPTSTASPPSSPSCSRSSGPAVRTSGARTPSSSPWSAHDHRPRPSRRGRRVPARARARRPGDVEPQRLPRRRRPRGRHSSPGVYCRPRRSAGERDPATVCRARGRLIERPRPESIRLDYVEVRRAASNPASGSKATAGCAVAAFVGNARLIDNVTMFAPGTGVSTDLGGDRSPRRRQREERPQRCAGS